MMKLGLSHSVLGGLLGSVLLLTGCQNGTPLAGLPKPAVSAALDATDPAAPQLKVQSAGAVSVEYAVNGNPVRTVALPASGAVPLADLCPGKNSLIYSVKVGAVEVIGKQTSQFTLSGDSVYTPVLSPATLTVGKTDTVAIPITEKVPLGCDPKVQITADKGLPLTVSSAEVSGVAGNRVIKAAFLANAASSGNVTLSLTWGDSTRTFTLPVALQTAPPEGTGPAITALTVTPNPLNLSVGMTFTLKTEFQGTGAFSRKLSFKTDNVDVATVDGQGVVTAVAVGKTILTVTPLDAPGKAVKVPLMVTAAPAFQLVSQPSSLALTAGASATFALNLQAQNGYNGSATIVLPSLPSGVTATLSSPTVSPGAPVQVTLSAAANAPTSNTLLVFGATDTTNLSASATLGLQVNVATNTPPTTSGDTTPPVISSVSPASGSVIVDSSVLIRANVNDNSAIKNVTLWVNGVQATVLQAQADNIYQTIWDVSKLNSGNYAMQIQASDQAGNKATWSGTFELARPSGGPALLRRFSYERSPTSNVAFAGGFGFVGTGPFLNRFGLNNNDTTPLQIGVASIESLAALDGRLYVSAADNTVTILDPTTLSTVGTVTLPAGRTTNLRAGGSSLFIGTRAGLVMLSGTTSRVLSREQVTALAINPAGGAYAGYVGGKIDAFSAAGTLNAQSSNTELGFMQVAGGQLYGGNGLHLFKIDPASLVGSETNLSTAPGGTIVGVVDAGGTTVLGDAAGLLTSVRGAQIQLDGAVQGAPVVAGDLMYVATKNYSMYVVRSSAGSLDVVSQTKNLGLVVAPTAVDGLGHVYYVSLNGVYVFNP